MNLVTDLRGTALMNWASNELHYQLEDTIPQFHTLKPLFWPLSPILSHLHLRGTACTQYIHGLMVYIYVNDVPRCAGWNGLDFALPPPHSLLERPE